MIRMDENVYQKQSLSKQMTRIESLSSHSPQSQSFSVNQSCGAMLPSAGQFERQRLFGSGSTSSDSKNVSECFKFGSLFN